jgi:hypothetical protein
LLPKVAARYCGPFKILENIGPIAYMLAFLAYMRVHNVFHVYLLKKYVPESNHIIDWIVIQVEQEEDFWVQPMHILNCKFKFLRNKDIVPIKVQWTCYCHEDTTCENEETMPKEYP